MNNSNRQSAPRHHNTRASWDAQNLQIFSSTLKALNSLGWFGRTARGAGFSAVLCATVHLLLHHCLLIVKALTGEVVELQEPARFHYHIGAGVTRDGIVRDGLQERKGFSFNRVFMDKGISASTGTHGKGISGFHKQFS